MSLRFSLFMQPVHDPRENPTLALERDLDLIQHLDKLGFDEVWVGEHHSTGWETIASPEIFMAVAAERTRHIRFGTGVMALPVHHPLLVADNLILLDHLTRGRVMLGVGIGGGLPSDHYVFGLNRDTARLRFRESFDALMTLLGTLEPVSLKTDWFELREAVLQLRPYQANLPVAIATVSPDGYQLAGQHGARVLSLVPPDKLSQLWSSYEAGAGQPRSRDTVDLGFNIHLAESKAQALEDIRVGAARERYDFSTPVTGSPLPNVSREAWAEELATRPTDIIGTPDEAIHKIEAALEGSGGFGGVLIRSNEWTSREAKWRSFELLARYVMPHFKGSLHGLKAAEKVAKNFVSTRQAA
jgi:limonene 1,2-monooxygenase